MADQTQQRYTSMTGQTFIEDRLKSLQGIEINVVNVIEKVGILFDHYVEPITLHDSKLTTTKVEFQEKIRDLYACLSSVAIELRKEVKVMDDNIGVHSNNADLIMILPISVDKKNTSVGSQKLESEIKKLDS